MRHVASVRKINTQQIFERKPEENGSFDIHVYRPQWEDNIKMYLNKTRVRSCETGFSFIIFISFQHFFKLVADLWLSQKRDTS
jgi:hypothetical protein